MGRSFIGEKSHIREHAGLVVGATGLMTAGVLTTFLAPILANSFAEDHGFGIERAGWLVSSAQGSLALSVLLMVPALPRLDRRKVGTAGALTVSTSLCLMAFTNRFDIALALQIVIGVGAGLSFASANSALAFARLPERAFSITTITWMVIGSVMLTLGPVLHGMWPRGGIYIGIAAAELLCIAAAVRLPDVRGLPKDRTDGIGAVPTKDRGGVGNVIAAPLLLVAIAVSETGNSMIWTFGESLGVHAGLSEHTTATVLGLSQLIGLAGAAITLLIGDKVQKMFLIVPAITALAFGNFLVGTADTAVWFVVGLVVVSIGYYCQSPLLLALAAELDTTAGKLVVLAGGVTLAVGGVAPALGGWIASRQGNWSQLGIAAMALGLSALPLLVIPVKAARGT